MGVLLVSSGAVGDLLQLTENSSTTPSGVSESSARKVLGLMARVSSGSRLASQSTFMRPPGIRRSGKVVDAGQRRITVISPAWLETSAIVERAGWDGLVAELDPRDLAERSGERCRAQDRDAVATAQ